MVRYTRLREIRERQGVTQAELSRRLKVSQQAVFEWEHRTDAKVSTLLRWAKALDVDFVELVVVPRKLRRKVK